MEGVGIGASRLFGAQPMLDAGPRSAPALGCVCRASEGFSTSLRFGDARPAQQQTLQPSARAAASLGAHAPGQAAAQHLPGSSGNPAVYQQGGSLVLTPLSVPALGPKGVAASGTPGGLQVLAVFQYITLPQLQWPAQWSLLGSRSKPSAAPAPVVAPGSSSAGSGSSTSGLGSGSSTSSQGSAAGTSGAASSGGGGGPRVRVGVSSAYVAGETSSDLFTLSPPLAQLPIPGPIPSQASSYPSQASQQPSATSPSWFVSFLVNYSLVMSAWWQFKHTAPGALEQMLHASVLPKALPLLQTPLPLLASAVAAIPPLPFNPLLQHALSPIRLFRGLRPPWLPAPTELKPEDGQSTGAHAKGKPQGGSDSDEAVESVVVDDMEPGMVWGQRHKDVQAEAERGAALAPYGFSFSAAGLLFPYHLGVTQFLSEAGILTKSTPLAGASAGAIVCATIAAGVESRAALEYTKALAADCRENGTAFRLGAVLRQTLEDLLPEDAHIQCSGRIRVAVTQVFGQPRGLLVDQFDSKEDLIEALFTSSFIPGYLAPRPITKFRNRVCVDGGLTLFIPPTASQNTVRVCAFPASALGLSNVTISPDARGKDGWSMRQLFEWALEPAEDEYLDRLFQEGYSDAAKWLASGAPSDSEYDTLPLKDILSLSSSPLGLGGKGP